MSQKTVIGQVIGVHALAGEFKVKPLTDYPDRFFDMKTLSLYSGGDFVRSLTVNKVRCLEGHNKAAFIFACKEILNINEAQLIVGCSLYVEEDEKIKLPEGEYWIDDLIGMSFVESGKMLGTVKDFVRSGGNELYIVEGTDGKERMIPAVGEFIKNIDIRSRTITVSLIEGLW